MRPAVLLDRDGTINDDVGYLTDLDNLVIYPWAGDAIRLLRRAGFAIVVITNQGGVARGLATTAFVEDTHRVMAARLDAGGAHVDAWRYCPHHPDGITPELAALCACRKPEPGLALDAARELSLDLSRSWVIGDHWRDVQLGHAVGARSILIRTGHGRDQEAARSAGQRVEAICDNLMHAVAVILSGAGSREPGAGNREPGAGNREPGAGSREPGTGNREPGAGSREPFDEAQGGPFDSARGRPGNGSSARVVRADRQPGTASKSRL